MAFLPDKYSVFLSKTTWHKQNATSMWWKFPKYQLIQNKLMSGYRVLHYINTVHGMTPTWYKQISTLCLRRSTPTLPLFCKPSQEAATGSHNQIQTSISRNNTGNRSLWSFFCGWPTPISKLRPPEQRNVNSCCSCFFGGVDKLFFWCIQKRNILNMHITDLAQCVAVSSALLQLLHITPQYA